jgi:radical SAM superfamily enzyme YgiQ (UPF0313 family)
MKVVLVIPANAPGAYRLEQKLPFAIENLAVGYLASHLSARGIDWRIIDGYAHGLSHDELVGQILAVLADCDVLAFTVLQSTTEEVRSLARAIRYLGFGGPIVLGGWAATMTTQELMGYILEADYALPGESEAIFPNFVEAIRQGYSIESLPNVVWREDGALRFSKVAAEPLAFSHPILPMHYGYDPVAREPFTRAPLPIQGSRGCFWGRCTFCSTAARYGAKAWRFRSSESLLGELSSIRLDGAQSRVFFVDDEFFGPTEYGFRRAREFAERVLTAGLQFEFGLDCLLTDFDPDLFSLLRRAGLRKVFMGIDAGTNRSLKTFKKPYPAERIAPTLARLRALDIEAIFGFIMFEPYMTLSDVRQNVFFLARDLDYFGDPGKYLSKLDPEYGTDLWARLSRDGLLTGSFPDWGFHFRDSQVAYLYRQLEGPVLELKAQYLATGDDRRAEIGQQIREEFLTYFEREYLAITVKTTSWGSSGSSVERPNESQVFAVGVPSNSEP